MFYCCGLEYEGRKLYCLKLSLAQLYHKANQNTK